MNRGCGRGMRQLNPAPPPDGPIGYALRSLHGCKFAVECPTFAPPKGRLAQLVQSTSFTPRGSGVRVPHRPPHSLSIFVV